MRISIELQEIIQYIGSNEKIIRKPKTSIHNFRSIQSASEGDMTFCTVYNKRTKKIIDSSNASLIICPLELKNKIKNTNSNLIFVKKPRLSFLRCVNRFYKKPATKKAFNHKSIIQTKNIGKNVYIGPFVYIEKEVSIGNNVIIHPHVCIYSNTKIGNNVIVDSFTSIGLPGFGFEKNESNKWESFPHIGGVQIDDDVEIGANVCIDKATLENTIIGRGTKIDNLVHIAHNVKIGQNCIIVANSLLGGGSTLGDNSYIAMSVTIRDGIKIGKNSFVGMGSVVTRDVKPNSTVIGAPARPYKK